ncbi:uncharacterized protein PV09_01993 [Verruconis gallopava]|uniref:Mitochondrial outer membrane transport complex Sam37/metaxin N-terminal domain-containing protein n=1 Tax=Verruconis gallopava TaxID=253628 RepID=A0A0D2AKM8_9PEZI|nr:uncharacterized protein PV09_01993 [Verruconis gallopava]KIW07120.1 hypothetical protein PV09_01993 [Verruconis gallopava]
MMKLHIWGPLDDLPSIDAECMATLAYLLKFDESKDFNISPGFDPTSSPNGDFPVLEHNGNVYAGYKSISAYLSSRRSAPQSSDLQPDIEAWSAFIQLRGQPLLDLYLYVSSNNYWNSISPVFTSILPWYSNYIVPPARRAAAIARTKHLGIRSLDLDSVDENAARDDSRHAGQRTAANLPSGITNPEQLVMKQQSASWLRTQQHADTFQLFQLTTSFFGPLQDLLGDKNYLLSNDVPTSLDCFAVGYLALMRKAPVPQPWLADALRTRFPKLDEYIQRTYGEIFENPSCPWKSKLITFVSPTISRSVAALARAAIYRVLPSLRKTTTLDPLTQQGLSKDKDSISHSILSSLLAPTVLLPLGALTGLAFGIAKYLSTSDLQQGGNSFYAHERDFLTPTRLTDLGESGAILSALGQRIDLEKQYERERERTGGATLVEVDVEDVERKSGQDIVYTG